MDNFRLELTKIFLIISAGLVLIIGLMAEVPFEVIFIRVLFGGTFFAIMGYLMGKILDSEQEKKEVAKQKKMLKSQMKNKYEESLEKKESNDIGFEPLDVDSLTKIVVGSLDK